MEISQWQTGRAQGHFLSPQISTTSAVVCFRDSGYFFPFFLCFLECSIFFFFWSDQDDGCHYDYINGTMKNQEAVRNLLLLSEQGQI